MAKITDAIRLGSSFKISDEEQTSAPKMRFRDAQIVSGIEYHEHSTSWQSGSGDAPAIKLNTAVDSAYDLPLANLPDHTHTGDANDTGGKLETDGNLTLFIPGNITVQTAVITGLIPFRNGATLKNIYLGSKSYASGTSKIDIKRSGVSLTANSGFQLSEAYYSNTPNASAWTSTDTLEVDVLQGPSGGQGADLHVIVQFSQVVG